MQLQREEEKSILQIVFEFHSLTVKYFGSIVFLKSHSSVQLFRVFQKSFCNTFSVKHVKVLQLEELAFSATGNEVRLVMSAI